MKQERHAKIEICSCELDDMLLIECCRCLGRPERSNDVIRMVQTIEGNPQYSTLSDLGAAAHPRDKAVSGKLRDGVTILNPEFVRALLTKSGPFPLEAGDRTSVAGTPDRAVGPLGRRQS